MNDTRKNFMSGIFLGVLCNVFYYLFILILHIMSNKSFEVIEAISVVVFIRYSVRIVLLYFILSFIYFKAIESIKKLANKNTKE